MKLKGDKIGNLIKDQVPNADLPAPIEGKRWLRFPCPFCGKPDAAINYQVGWFECYHESCQVKICTRGTPEIVWRFTAQIGQAVRNVNAKYGRWVKIVDLRQQAFLEVIGYDQLGKLDDWEMDVKGDPDQLDRFVLQALNCDLLNFADKTMRRIKREDSKRPDAPILSQARPTDESVEDRTIWVSWPTLELRFRYNLTDREIAERLGISLRTAKRRIATELADAATTYQ